LLGIEASTVAASAPDPEGVATHGNEAEAETTGVLPTTAPGTDREGTPASACTPATDETERSSPPRPLSTIGTTCVAGATIGGQTITPTATPADGSGGPSSDD
jgi:hypothetical protein